MTLKTPDLANFFPFLQKSQTPTTGGVATLEQNIFV